MTIAPTDAVPVPAASATQLPPQLSNATPAEKSAYAVALGFEQVLVTQLAQQLTETSQSGSDGSVDGDPSDGSDPSGGSDPASAQYAQLLPQALSQGVMSAGGLGIAAQIASSLVPDLGGSR